MRDSDANVAMLEAERNDDKTTLTTRKFTTERLAALKRLGGFHSLDALLNHFAKLAEQDSALLSRGRSR